MISRQIGLDKGNTFMHNTFGKLYEDSDTIIRSCYCNQAMLNENTGIYGCCLLESECPYDTPDPKRCKSSERFQRNFKRRILVPNVYKAKMKKKGHK